MMRPCLWDQTTNPGPLLKRKSPAAKGLQRAGRGDMDGANFTAGGQSMSRPIGLSDDQLLMVQRLAEPLHPQLRSQYLQRVAELLDGCEIGDGAVGRAARQAQSELINAPALDEQPRRIIR